MLPREKASTKPSTTFLFSVAPIRYLLLWDERFASTRRFLLSTPQNSKCKGIRFGAEDSSWISNNIGILPSLEQGTGNDQADGSGRSRYRQRFYTQPNSYCDRTQQRL